MFDITPFDTPLLITDVHPQASPPPHVPFPGPIRVDRLLLFKRLIQPLDLRSAQWRTQLLTEAPRPFVTHRLIPRLLPTPLVARWRRHFRTRSESDGFDIAPQPGVDRFPIEISSHHQSDDEPVMLGGVTPQLETVDP